MDRMDRICHPVTTLLAQLYKLDDQTKVYALTILATLAYVVVDFYFDAQFRLELRTDIPLVHMAPTFMIQLQHLIVLDNVRTYIFQMDCVKRSFVARTKWLSLPCKNNLITNDETTAMLIRLELTGRVSVMRCQY